MILNLLFDFCRWQVEVGGVEVEKEAEDFYSMRVSGAGL